MLVASTDGASMDKLLNNPHAPDLFADGATGYLSLNGNMRITFEAVRSDYSTNPHALDRVVVGLVVMPIAAAEAMANAILQHVALVRNAPNQDANTTMQ